MTIPKEGVGKGPVGMWSFFVLDSSASWGRRRFVRCVLFAGGLLALSLVLFGQGDLVPKVFAARLPEVYPDLKVDPGSRGYDYPKAQAQADRLLMTLRHLSGYACLSQTYYSLKRIRGGRSSGPRPDESFDLEIRFSPLSVAVRMRFPRKGATVRYRSVEGVAVVRPFGFLPLSLSLSPKSSLITSRFGHTIDHADFLSYDRRILRPSCLTHSCLYLGSGRFAGRPVGILGIAPDQLEARPVFGRMWLLLDRETAFPLSVATEGPDGLFWERIDYLRCHLYPAGGTPVALKRKKK